MDLLLTPLPPYAYDLFGLLVILIFALRGARRGFVAELTTILSLLAALALARPFGSFLQEYLPLQSLPSSPQRYLAWSIGVVLVYVLARILLSIGVRWSGLRREQEGTLKTALQLGGAGVRGSLGLLTCIVIGWSVVSTGRLSALLLSATPSLKETPPWFHTLLLPLKLVATHSEAFSQSLLGTLSTRTNPLPQELMEGTEVLVEIAQEPEHLQQLTTYEPLRRVVTQPSVQHLLQNEEVRTLAEKQDILGLLHHPAVKQAMEDPAVQEALQQIEPEELRKFLKTTK